MKEEIIMIDGIIERINEAMISLSWYQDDIWFDLMNKMYEKAVELKERLEKQPEIIRCKDCKYNNPFGCDKHGMIVSDNYFCADGVKG